MKKKNFLQKFLALLIIYYPQIHLIKAHNSLDFSRLNGRISENAKSGGFREPFLPEVDLKTSSAVNFPKRHPDFGGLETNQRHETQTRNFFFICPSTYKLNTV